MRISVFESSELQGVLLAMRGVPRELAAQLRKATKDAVGPIWREELAQAATTEMDSLVLVAPASVAVTNQNVTLRTGYTAKKLSGGGRVYELMPGTEFGATTEPQFRPRKKAGYTALPAASRAIPRLASLWVQTIIRTLYEAFEAGK